MYEKVILERTSKKYFYGMYRLGYVMAGGFVFADKLKKTESY